MIFTEVTMWLPQTSPTDPKGPQRLDKHVLELYRAYTGSLGGALVPLEGSDRDGSQYTKIQPLGSLLSMCTHSHLNVPNPPQTFPNAYICSI